MGDYDNNVTGSIGLMQAMRRCDLKNAGLQLVCQCLLQRSALAALGKQTSWLNQSGRGKHTSLIHSRGGTLQWPERRGPLCYF
jgi:hypothetical protein